MDLKKIPSLEETERLLRKVFQSSPTVEKFLLPHDLADQFFYANWKYPERYFEESVRNGTSVFALTPEHEIAELLARLETDLKSGQWDRLYGPLRDRNQYDGGYYFILTSKNPD